MIVWQGNSQIDGAPIVVIATMDSKNKKTGAMVQTWIIRSDIDPIQASRKGLDTAICGNCPHKGIANPDKASGWADKRSCYVNLLHGPASIYNAFKRGAYKPINTNLLKGKFIRFGSYGDPLAVPNHVWENLASLASGVTSYTHSPDFTSKIHMISVDSEKQALEVKQKGFRYFRVSTDRNLQKNEILCPASKEAGARVVCQDCRLCDGRKSAKDIVIIAHGHGKKHIHAVNI